MYPVTSLKSFVPNNWFLMYWTFTVSTNMCITILMYVRGLHMFCGTIKLFNGRAYAKVSINVLLENKSPMERIMTDHETTVLQEGQGFRTWDTFDVSAIARATRAPLKNVTVAALHQFRLFRVFRVCCKRLLKFLDVLEGLYPRCARGSPFPLHPMFFSCMHVPTTGQRHSNTPRCRRQLSSFGTILCQACVTTGHRSVSDISP